MHQKNLSNYLRLFNFSWHFSIFVNCSTTKRPSSKLLINSGTDHICCVVSGVSRLADPHSFSRCSSRYRQIHQQSKSQSPLIILLIHGLEFFTYSFEYLLLCSLVLLCKYVKCITSLFFSQIMDTIKGTMTEIYNDLSKSTSGNTIAEVIPPSHIDDSSKVV